MKMFVCVSEWVCVCVCVCMCVCVCVCKVVSVNFIEILNFIYAYCQSISSLCRLHWENVCGKQNNDIWPSSSSSKGMIQWYRWWWRWYRWWRNIMHFAIVCGIVVLCTFSMCMHTKCLYQRRSERNEREACKHIVYMFLCYVIKLKNEWKWWYLIEGGCFRVVFSQKICGIQTCITKRVAVLVDAQSTRVYLHAGAHLAPNMFMYAIYSKCA